MTNINMFINVPYSYYHFAPWRPAAKRGGQPLMRGVWGSAAHPVRNKVLLNVNGFEDIMGKSAFAPEEQMLYFS